MGEDLSSRKYQSEGKEEGVQVAEEEKGVEREEKEEEKREEGKGEEGKREEEEEEEKEEGKGEEEGEGEEMTRMWLNLPLKSNKDVGNCRKPLKRVLRSKALERRSCLHQLRLRPVCRHPGPPGTRWRDKRGGSTMTSFLRYIHIKLS